MIRDRCTDVCSIRLLIAEDEEHLGTILEHFLRGRGYDVTMCRDGRAALQALHSAPFDVALLDIVMPEMDGLEVLRHLQSEPEPPEVIIITGNGSIDTAINAIKLGAYDYISKPYRMAEIDVMVRRAWEKRELVKANAMLRGRAAKLPRVLTSANVAMQDSLRTVTALAAEREPLVIAGEPGVGKSYVARYVHALSGRARDALVEVTASDGRLVTVADLFGSEGAASGGGASGSATGLLLLADRGTAVVDIARLDQDAAAVLRRAVADGCFVRVGGSREIALTARVIVCVRDAVAGPGTDFPASACVSIPALRLRSEDMDRLAAELLMEIEAGMCTITSDAVAALRGYSWPGNVREMKMVLTRASSLTAPAAPEAIGASDVRMLLASGSLGHEGQGAPLDELERLHIESMLARCNWHQGRAAVALGISTKTLYRKMRQYGFRRPRKRKIARVRPAA